MNTEVIVPLTYPMRPINGGPLDLEATSERYRLSELANQPDRWAFEPKFNGWRALVHDTERTMFNRHNKRLSIANEFHSALLGMSGCGDTDPWWDVEALDRRHGIGRGSLVVLDWVSAQDDYAFRRATVTSVGEKFDWQDTPFKMKNGALYAVPSFDWDEACLFWQVAPLINEMLGCVFYEGLVAKRLDSKYNLQLRSDTLETTEWIKHRFTTL